MPSLHKRATPAQAKILRIVEGAVLNTADAHGVTRDTWMARSIAKRAAGTLTAQWPEVLAVNSRLPARGTVLTYGGCRACERRELLALLRERRERTKGVRGLTERRASQLLRRPPLLVLWQRVSREMWKLKNDPVRYTAHQELLRLIHALRVEIEISRDLVTPLSAHGNQPTVTH